MARFIGKGGERGRARDAGQFGMKLRRETYKGEERLKFVGKIPISNTEAVLVNISVDGNMCLFTYPGKTKTDETYCRGFATIIKDTQRR